MGNKNTKILHITEALGGGVLNIVQQIANSQAESGFSVSLLHSLRADTPGEVALANLFPSPIKRIITPMATKISPAQDIKALRAILKTIKNESPDIIHLHSSKAGVLGRIACLLAGKRNACFYTPHGYSFLRKDVSSKKRTLFKLIEKISAYIAGTTLACSQSELEHTVTTLGHKKALLIENSIPTEQIPAATGSTGPSCLISTSARLCPQKNPSAFRDLAIRLQQIPAHFMWIGGGELECDLHLDGQLPENLSCTGWVSREQVTEYLKTSDIYVMTSLWEGMPLSLLEAQVAGLPAVVPDVEGCKDIVIDQVTGFICKTPEEMAEKIDLLIADIDLRKTMGKAARELGLQRFSPERMHREMMLAYQTATKTSPQELAWHKPSW